MASIYKQNKSRFWWVKYRDSQGNLLRKSLKTPHKGVALECKRQIESQLQISTLANPTEFEEVVTNFLTAVRTSRNYTHYLNIRGRLQRFLTVERIDRYEQITAAAVQSFCNSLTVVNLAPRTVKGHYQSIRSFCHYLRSHYLLESDPCQNIQLPRPTILPPKFMTLYECKRALVIARRRSDFLFHVLAAYLLTGMRRNEVRLLEWPDLSWPNDGDPNTGRITIRQGKGRKYRIIPFHPRLVDLLRPLRLPAGPVFPGQRGACMGHKQWESLLHPVQDRLPIFARYFKSAFHLLRYTFGSLYVTAGGDIYRLSQILGHTSVSTTQRTYAHLQDSPDPIFARYPPR